MHYAGCMHRHQSPRQSRRDTVKLVSGQWSSRAHVRLQRWAGDVLRGEPRPGRLGVGAQHPDGAGTADFLEERDLPDETRAKLRIVSQLRVNDLHRDALTGSGQPGVDDSHPTGPQSPDWPKRTDLRRIVVEKGT